MKKLGISLLVIVMMAIETPAWAVGGGTIILPGHVQTDAGAKWEYGVGLSPRLGLTCRFNDNLAAVMSLMLSRLPATGKYKTGWGEELTTVDGKLDYFHLVADGKYIFRPDKMLRPYLMSGVGFYRWGCEVKAKNKETGTQFTNQIKPGNNLGVNLGAGATFELTDGFFLGVGSKYHYLFSDYYQKGVVDITLDFKFKF